jgi:phosphatidylglycerol:prolipoprotein diacylglycerol transferase
MRPQLFTVFGHVFHAYPVMLAAAFVVSVLLAVREAEKRGIWLPPAIGLWVFVGALIGAKALFILQYGAWTDLWRALLIWQPGLVYYGGLAGGLAGGLLFAWVFRVPTLMAADVAVPYLALGQGITRIGCFLNGCCWGAASTAPWAMEFPRGCRAYAHYLKEGLIDFSAESTPPLHPTQLYMIGGLILTFAVLKFALSRQRFNGQIGLLYALCYGVLRFVVEFFRGDSARSVYGLTMSQAISLALVIAGLAGLAFAWRKGWFSRPIMVFETPEAEQDASEAAGTGQ